MMHKIAFNTANLVARVTGYRFAMKDWGEQHRKTAEATDERAWRAICQEVAGASYTAIEVWEAHAPPERMLGTGRAMVWRRIMTDAGLQPIGYAGELRPETADVCLALGIPVINGRIHSSLNVESATDLCRSTGVRFNLENHPEKTAEELLHQIGGGNASLGVCIDTGWLGTQGVDAPDFVRAVGGLVRHVHVKDVMRPGHHETCPLSEGCVDLPAVFKALKDVKYCGWYSWEDEPEARNPMQTAEANRTWIKRHL